MEVRNDFHLLGERFGDVLLEKVVADRSNGVEIGMDVEVVENVLAWGSIFAALTERGDRDLVGGRADKDLEEVVRFDVSVLAEIEVKRPGEDVDEKVKELSFVISLSACWWLVDKTPATRHSQ